MAGPLHAGAFGPGKTDPTFGIEVASQKVPAVQNEAPNDGNQFFGQVDIDGRSRSMTVALKDRIGTVVYWRTLAAEPV